VPKLHPDSFCLHPDSLRVCCNKIAETEAAVSVNEEQWLVMQKGACTCGGRLVSAPYHAWACCAGSEWLLLAHAPVVLAVHLQTFARTEWYIAQTVVGLSGDGVL